MLECRKQLKKSGKILFMWCLGQHATSIVLWRNPTSHQYRSGYDLGKQSGILVASCSNFVFVSGWWSVRPVPAAGLAGRCQAGGSVNLSGSKLSGDLSEYTGRRGNILLNIVFYIVLNIVFYILHCDISRKLKPAHCSH